MDKQDFLCEPDEDASVDLGPCCACGSAGPSVRNIFMIDRRAPVAGHGWGCVVCRLPQDGASYVLCDACAESGREPKFACRGYPKEDGRVAIELLTETFFHDGKKHEEEQVG